MKTSLKRREYHSYTWKKRELVAVTAQAVGIVLLLAYFFYRSILAVIPLSVVGIAFFWWTGKKKAKRCREELTFQFRECILSVSAALKAGYAVENAFLESRSDMRLLFGEDSLIYKELELIRRGMIINITLEEQLEDLAARSGCEEISQFAAIFSVAKKSGGSIPEIIGASAELIGQRADAAWEMQTLLSGRKLEQNIMKLMPFGILIFIGSSYQGYFDSLYHNLQGIAVMTVCLMIYLAAYVLGEKIMEDITAQMS